MIILPLFFFFFFKLLGAPKKGKQQRKESAQRGHLLWGLQPRRLRGPMSLHDLGPFHVYQCAAPSCWAALIYKSSYLPITLHSGVRKKPLFLGNEAKWWCWQGNGKKSGGSTGEVVSTRELLLWHDQRLWLKTQAHFFSGNAF